MKVASKPVKKLVGNPIHKGIVYGYLYNYCDDGMGGYFSMDWQKVTCKRCLKKRGK